MAVNTNPFYPTSVGGFNTQYQGTVPNQQTQPLMVALISSEDEMRNYIVAAGSSVILVAFNLGKFWLKSTSANGVPQQPREFIFNEKLPEPPTTPITRDEFNKLSEKVQKLIEELGGEK